jgi:hypothetical protein
VCDAYCRLARAEALLPFRAPVQVTPVLGRTHGGRHLGTTYPRDGCRVEVNVARPIPEVAHVLAHELGHVADWCRGGDKAVRNWFVAHRGWAGYAYGGAVAEDFAESFAEAFVPGWFQSHGRGYPDAETLHVLRAFGLERLPPRT